MDQKSLEPKCSSSSIADVAMDAMIHLKSVSKSSLNSRNDVESPDFSLSSKTTLATKALFKKAALKSLKMRNQNKLIFDEAMKHQQQSNDSLMTASISPSLQPSQYELESNKDYVNKTMGRMSSSDVLFKEPTDEELTSACYAALRTCYDLKSFQSKEDNNKLMTYSQKVFGQFPQFGNILHEVDVKANQERNLAIKCELIEGSGLPARDANGLSDPYCRMVVLNKRFIEEKIVKKGDIKTWVEEGLVKLEHVNRSSVRFKTLEPKWNSELFEFVLTNPEEEFLVIEVWDSDEDDHKKKIKGLKGFGNFLRDLASEDDFMGRAFYHLKSLCFEEEEKVIPLYSHSTKHERGTVTLKLSIVDKDKKFHSEEEKASEFKNISKAIMAHESFEDDEFIRRWDGKLSETGSELLSHYATLRSLPKIREVSICFSLLMDYHKSYAISMPALQVCTDNMKKLDKEINRLKEMPIPPDWVVKVFQEVQELYTDIVSILKIHLDRFSFKSAEDIEELKAYVITLRSIYSSKVLCKDLCDCEEDFETTVTNAIQHAVPMWFLNLSANLMPSRSTSQDHVIAFKALSAHCLRECIRIIDKVQPEFKEVGIDYFSPFFYSLDKLIFTECETVVSLSSSYTNNCMLMLYEIFRTLQNLKNVAVEHVKQNFLQAQSPSSLYIVTYHRNFKGTVPVWIELAQARAKERLKNAVGLDTVASYNDQAPFSSSAVDAHGMFIQVINFWKDLSWPDREQSVGYFATIIQALSDLALYYADLITTKVDQNYSSTVDDKFIVTDELCIALNNIQHMRTVVADDLSDELDLQSYYMFLDEDSVSRSDPHQQVLSQRAEDLRKNILSSVDEDILEKKNRVIRALHKKMTPTVSSLMAEVMSKDHDIPPDTAVEPLLDYIAGNMGKLVNTLLTPNFLSILEQLWLDVVKILRDNSNLLSHKTINIPLFERLKGIAMTLEDFFEANGDGLKREVMETTSYKLILKEVSLAASTTQQLLRAFLKDMVSQQEKASSELGVLRFSHIYNQDDKALKITVVSAENIPALDKSGLSDPYVAIHLLPVDLFPKISETTYKTSVKKKTLSPFYNESFTMEIERYKLKEEGAIILLAMYDHDRFGANDFAGICVVPLSSTPQGNELKMEHLNLFHHHETLAYKEIEGRSSENLAHDFLKLMKKFVPEAKSGSHPLSPTHTFSHFKKFL